MVWPKLHVAAERADADTDQQVCDALVAGKPWAAEALYDRVEETVDTVLYRVVGAGDAERDDLMQQALEKIIGSVVSGQFSRRCSLNSWAAVITQHVAYDALRVRARERTVLDRTVSRQTLELVAAEVATPERAVELRRGIEALHSALAATKRERAEAVILHDVLGHELSEISVLTGVSVAAAQSRLVRGRRDVAKRMRALASDRKGRNRDE
ncbi:MAG TPA: RNA polymerase sigma factor [Polyangia bacterium]